ncbi:ribokinase [Aliiroseovarius sp. KMU-50]|uniref:Ribokinase n=1 Tax=Aliiroseovarius salicola TaxID=3009082 RepID=A0ABT4VXI6_9RHOB|nr:ribokinase [Aliiroseovarius sp. KMU-50]MDA5092966.1 ribokinase [Aliiroseovarius sp. KMU-50]
MTIFNLGSINIDNFYYLSHLPKAGETLSSDRYAKMLGGKGANQSVAAARAGSETCHIGAIGKDGAWCLAVLSDAGVDVSHVAVVPATTGHANICVDREAENMIVLVPGANHELELSHIENAFAQASEDDTLILQNETNLVKETAQLARAKSLRVIYSAAPFDAQAVQDVLPYCDLLVMNEVEAAQLSDALDIATKEIDVPAVLITRGSKGAVWRDQRNGREILSPAFAVIPVDTTGAGDCFIGYVASGLDLGLPVEDALRRASAASAIQVTREGTAEAMPTADEVSEFLIDQG